MYNSDNYYVWCNGCDNAVTLKPYRFGSDDPVIMRCTACGELDNYKHLRTDSSHIGEDRVANLVLQNPSLVKDTNDLPLHLRFKY